MSTPIYIRSLFLLFTLFSASLFAAYEPDGTELSAVTSSNDIKKLILEYAYEWQERGDFKNGVPAYSVAYSLDSRYLLIGSSRGLIRIYDAAFGKCLAELSNEKKFSRIEFFNWCRGKPAGGWRQINYALCALPNQKFLVAKGTGRLLLYDMSNIDKIREKSLYKTFLGTVDNIVVSQKKQIALVSSGDLLKVFTFNKAEEVTDLMMPRKSLYPSVCTFSPDGSYLVSDCDNILKISETKNFRTIATLRGYMKYDASKSIYGAVRYVIWPTQNCIISIVYEKIEIWDVSDFSRPTRIKEIDTFARNLLSVHGNKYLIFDTAGDDDFGNLPGNIEIWDIEKMERIEKLIGPVFQNKLVLSPNGRYLVAASKRFDGLIKMWENPAAALLHGISTKRVT